MEQRKIVAEVIKYALKETDTSLSQLADLYGSTRQNFSRIIRMEADVNPKIISFILENTTAREFNFDVSEFERSRDFFYTFLKAYYFSEDAKMKQMIEEMPLERFYSYASPYYLLTHAFHALYFRRIERLDIVLHAILDMYDCIPVEERDCVHYLMAYDHVLHHRDQEAYDLMCGFRVNRLVPYTLTEELFTIVCCELHKPLEGFEHLTNALRMYQNDNCHVRAISVSVYRGIFYMDVYNYKQAIRCFESLKRQAALYHRSDLVFHADGFLSISHMLTGEYDQAIMYEPKLKNGKYSEFHVIAMFWSYYFLNDMDECRHYMGMMKMCDGDKTRNELYRDLMGLYLDNAAFSLKEEKIEKILTLLSSGRQKRHSIFLLRILLQEYQRTDNYMKVAETQQRIMKQFEYDFSIRNIV